MGYSFLDNLSTCCGRRRYLVTYSKNQPAYKKLCFSKQAGQFLMKTSNYDKQADKFLITPVKKLKKYQCIIDIAGHDVPYQLMRMNRIPFYFGSKSLTN